MDCLYCNAQNPPGAQACARCGKPLPRYAAPDGFGFDPVNGLYCRPHGGGKTLFFDPVDGQYTVAEKPAAVSAPDGFTPDPVSGLSYRLDDSGVKGGGRIYFMTWYDPALREYAQVEYAVSEPGARRAAVPRATRKPVGKKPIIALLCIVMVAALAVGGWVMWQRGRFDGILSGNEAGVAFVDVNGESGSAEAPESADGGASADAAQIEGAGFSGAQDAEAQSSTARGEAIVWQDATFEKLVRAYLRRPEGDIFPEELDDVGEIKVDPIDMVLYFRSGSGSVSGVQADNQMDGIISVDDLAHFRKVETVEFYRVTNVDDFSVLSKMENLQTLGYWHIEPQWILPEISGLSNLRQLWVSECLITDLSGIETMTGLESIRLTHMPLTDISPLQSLPNLRRVEIDSTDVTDFSPIAHVPEVIGAPTDGAGASGGTGTGIQAFADRGMLLEEYFGDVEYDEARELAYSHNYGEDPTVRDGLDWFRSDYPRVDIYHGFSPEYRMAGDNMPVAVQLPVFYLFEKSTAYPDEAIPLFGDMYVTTADDGSDYFDRAALVYFDVGDYIIVFDVVAGPSEEVETITVYEADFFRSNIYQG